MFTSNKEALLWLSGLMDGEGCLTKRTIKKTGWETWALAFRMTDRDSLERAASAIEMLIHRKLKVLGPYHNGRRPKEKQIYALDLQGRDYIYALVCMMYPYLNKRRQLKIEEFITWYGRK